jgi:uncharacterized protein
MMRKPVYILLFYIIMIVLAGCASSPPPRFYTLSATVSPAVKPQADFTVSIGPVSVPAVVDRPQIIVRTGPNQVFIDEFDRWASPLKDDIARVIAENLISILGTTGVTTISPQSSATGSSYRIVIDILRFDSEPGKAAILDALWTVSTSNDGPSWRMRTSLNESTKGDDYASLVAAHSRALGKLSAEIAGKIQEIGYQKH